MANGTGFVLENYFRVKIAKLHIHNVESGVGQGVGECLQLDIFSKN